MKRRSTPAVGPPQLPPNFAAFSGQYHVKSKRSWERFVAELSSLDQAFQLILQADDESAARSLAMAFVHRHVVPYVKRSASHLRTRFDCDSPLGSPVGGGAYSVTFVAAVQRRLPRSR